MNHPPTPGTAEREQYDCDHGGYDSKPTAGRDEGLQAWRCPERIERDMECRTCDHGQTPHVYCPHVEHYCTRLERFIKCMEAK